MAVGRISGPLLKSNLTRDGVDLAFENDLLYLDVNSLRVGIKTSSPTADLTINGTTRTTDLEVTNQLDIGPITINGNTISSTSTVLNLTPASNGVVYQNKLTVDDIDIENNVISTNSTNTDLEIHTQGTGQVRIFADTEINGNLHVTGNIAADGNIQIGDVDTDNITFNADVASNIIPNITDVYDIGSSSKRWNSIWTNNFVATNVAATNIIVNGVDISLEQGNILYVAANGSDSNAGRHQNDPLASLEYALSLAVAGDTVLIYPGIYQETLPLLVPVGVSIKGMSLRNVIIEPDTSSQTEDVFHLNGETTIEDLTVRGHYYDSINNTGYAFRFATNFKVTNRSPYIKNVTVLTFGSIMTTLDPRGFNQGDAGKGAYIDGAVADPTTIEASMLFHSATFLCPGVDAVTITNGARVEWLNSFTYFADKGLYAISGTSGLASAGRTMVEVGEVTGTYSIGDSIEYYDDDNITLLASGTIAEVSGNKIYINGKSLGFVEYDTRIGKIVIAYNNAQISNTTAQFGTTSLALDGTGDYILSLPNQDYAYGVGDFTIEAWVRKSVASTQVLIDQRTVATDIAIYLESDTAGNFRLFVDGAYRLTSSVAISLNTWTHVAVSRASGITRLFVNGIVTPVTYADTNNYLSKPFRLGTTYLDSLGWNGYVDEVRISKGIARYIGTFTVPNSLLKNDTYTSLLLHFTGANSSTSIVDDSVLSQDIRFPVTNAVATRFEQVDYTDFGAEVRSIGSTCVYGNYGIYGDGVGIIMYLTGQNLAYIGLGKSADNDPLAVIQANEVVELNGAKIYYTSVDHKGDFRVGDLFYVNQQTGTVEFTSALLNVIGPTGITLTSGADQTTLSPTEISTGNIKISGNTVESVLGSINIAAANNIINFLNDVNILGNLDVTGNVTIGGNITIGDQTTDTISFVGGIASDLVPKIDSTYNVGLPSYQWKDLWVRTAHISDIDISTNVITTTISNANLELRANGTGSIKLEDISVNVNVISVPTNTDIILQPSGIGTVNINSTQSMILPKGTTAQRPTAPILTSGMIRYNTDNNNFEGYDGTYWRVLNGLYDVDQNTYLVAESTPGANDNTFYFYINGTQVADLNATRFNAARLDIDNIVINNNTISTLSNTNLTLDAQGTGVVNIENFSIKDNTITNTVSGSITEISHVGTGYFKIDGTRGFGLPVGNSGQRPGGTVPTGFIRYNTDDQRVEVYDGISWVSAAGASSGVTVTQAEEIAIVSVLMLG